MFWLKYNAIVFYKYKFIIKKIKIMWTKCEKCYLNIVSLILNHKLYVFINIIFWNKIVNDINKNDFLLIYVYIYCFWKIYNNTFILFVNLKRNLSMLKIILNSS